MKTILITDSISETARALLESQKDFRVLVDPNPNVETLAQTSALITRTRTKVTKEFLDHCTNLKFVVTATSGFDHIDVEEAHQRGIRVNFTPEGNQYSAAEMTWSLVLAVSRKLPAAFKMVEQGKWERERVRGVELRGKTYGIIGLGRIGTLVAKMAQGFGMEVIAFDPYANADRFKSLNVERLGLQEVLRTSDYLSLHVPLTRETHHMINIKTLELMNDTAYLINTSRGPVIAEQELIVALDEQWIAGVGLDVYEKEPLTAQSPLRRRPNVVLLPHCGANTNDAYERSCQLAAEKVMSFFGKADVSVDSGDPRQEAWYVAQQLNQTFKAEV